MQRKPRYTYFRLSPQLLPFIQGRTKNDVAKDTSSYTVYLKYFKLYRRQLLYNNSLFSFLGKEIPRFPQDSNHCASACKLKAMATNDDREPQHLALSVSNQHQPNDPSSHFIGNMFGALNRFISRLDAGPEEEPSSTPGFGFQVLRNTNSELPLDPWFDFIIGINGRTIVSKRKVEILRYPVCSYGVGQF